MKIFKKIRRKFNEFIKRIGENNEKYYGKSRMKCCGLEKNVK